MQVVGRRSCSIDGRIVIKNTKMSRKITVSVIGMMLLPLGILLAPLFLVGCGGSEEEDDPAASVSANPLVDEDIVKKGVEAIALNNIGACKAGMILVAGESCTYIANGEQITFFIDDNGDACRSGRIPPRNEVVFGVNVQIEATDVKFCSNDGFERDDTFKTRLAAEKNADGSWIITHDLDGPAPEPEPEPEPAPEPEPEPEVEAQDNTVPAEPALSDWINAPNNDAGKLILDRATKCREGLEFAEDTFCVNEGHTILVGHLAGGDGLVLMGGAQFRAGGDIRLGNINLVKNGDIRILEKWDP